MPRLGTSWAGLVSAVLALGADLTYLVIITGEEGSNDAGRVVLVAGTVAAAGVAVLAGSLSRSPSRRLVFLLPAATALLVWGGLALFSIGVVLLASGACAAMVAVRASTNADGRASLTALLGATAVVAGTIFGLVAT